MLKVSFIGFGNSVRNYHLPYLDLNKNISVISAFRRKEDRIMDREIENFYPDILFSENLDDLLDNKEIDLIVICTHVDSHAFYAKLALQKGKNVLIEKPFASSIHEAEEIFKIAKEKGLLAIANQNRRFDGDFLTLKKVIESGKLGKLVELESRYDYFKPNASKPEFDRLYGLAVHQIDQIVSLFGRPKKIHPDVRSIYYPTLSDDYIDIDLHYENFKASVKCSIFVKNKTPKFVLYGDKGCFIKFSSGHQKKVFNERNMITIEQEDEENWGEISYLDDFGIEKKEKIPSELTDYSLLYEGIMNAINKGYSKPIKDEEILTVMGILEESLETAKTGAL